ncbi:MAG: hypothetical protein ACLFU9_06945 [Candidatus Bathyarchaeia archaeon]
MAKGKRVVITIRLLPEASSLSNHELKSAMEEEIKKAVYTVPWVDTVESINVKES